MAQLQATEHPTSSRTGTLYFAYGSNLSAEQMNLRCTYSETSSVPIAVARLDEWKWIICERGYANIVPTAASERQSSDEGSLVWGILYNMTSEDEAILDVYEGHRELQDPERNPDKKTVKRTPFLQGSWDYNKWYIPVKVTKLLAPPSKLGLPSLSEEEVVTVLAYVDEYRVDSGEINYSYIGRMNRAIRESVAMGIPEDWINKVMRRWVTKDIEPESGYIGTVNGYVPGEETEAS